VKINFFTASEDCSYKLEQFYPLAVANGNHWLGQSNFTWGEWRNLPPVRSEPAGALAIVARRGAGADGAGDAVCEWAAGEYAGAGVSLSYSVSRQARVSLSVSTTRISLPSW